GHRPWCARTPRGHTSSPNASSGISARAFGSRSSASSPLAEFGSASGIAWDVGSPSSSTDATCSGIPTITRRSGKPSTPRSRPEGRPRARSARASGRGHRGVPSEQERERRKPQDFTDEGDNRGKGRDRSEDREGQHDGQAEVLERREGREGDLIISREAERPPEEDREGSDPKRPGTGERAEGEEQLGSLKQGTTRRARNRDDEEEEGDAHAARPNRDDR